MTTPHPVVVLHPWDLARRMLQHGAALLPLALLSLALGMAIYHWAAGLDWPDAFLNAAMLLGGMGPVDPLTNDSAKLFAGAYALYCGVVFIATAGLVLAPVGAHILHRFHLDRDR